LTVNCQPWFFLLVWRIYERCSCQTHSPSNKQLMGFKLCDRETNHVFIYISVEGKINYIRFFQSKYLLLCRSARTKMTGQWVKKNPMIMKNSSIQRQCNSYHDIISWFPVHVCNSHVSLLYVPYYLNLCLRKNWITCTCFVMYVLIPNLYIWMHFLNNSMENRFKKNTEIFHEYDRGNFV